MLTGKAKEKFEEWYKIRFEKSNLPYLDGFDISDLSIKWGVYIEWADSLGYYVDDDGDSEVYKPAVFYTRLSNKYNHIWTSEIKKTRKEAQIEAIKKLNELINKEG